MARNVYNKNVGFMISVWNCQCLCDCVCVNTAFRDRLSELKKYSIHLLPNSFIRQIVKITTSIVWFQGQSV